MSLRAALLAALATLAVHLAGPSARAQRPPGPAATMRELAREVAVEFTGRAGTAEREGRIHAAEALYHRAVEADPGFLPAHLGYARMLAARGRVDEALHALDVVPLRAIELDRDAVQLARARAALGDLDGALGFLATRGESPEATRARAELAAAAGRFPEALLAARRLVEISRATPEEARAAARLVRALAILVGDADAVQAPGPGAPLLRRLLAE
jgi:tetratricopeptide (TPR) repeat protein